MFQKGKVREAASDEIILTPKRERERKKERGRNARKWIPTHSFMAREEESRRSQPLLLSAQAGREGETRSREKVGSGRRAAVCGDGPAHTKDSQQEERGKSTLFPPHGRNIKTTVQPEEGKEEEEEGQQPLPPGWRHV